MIQFDYPLNERMRIFLRLESLFIRLHRLVHSTDRDCIQAAVMDIISVLHIFSCRVDLKAELIKELERHQALLKKYLGSPEADEDTLERLLKSIRPLLETLHQSDAGLGQNLREDEFIKSIMQRSGIPGGTCNFDLPIYHRWLCEPIDRCQKNLVSWCNEFATASEAILLIMDIIRNSVLPQEKIAEKGFMLLTLDRSKPFQMLHLKVDKSLAIFPEISGNRHRCVIRFMDFSAEHRPQQTKRDVPFLLTCCQL
ncbi:MAG: cell division protein ZapD [Gammaproteobacteria bacterium]|nr:MAG: cell division protein ZapD [Gammaproteobacteria bacterium]